MTITLSSLQAPRLSRGPQNVEEPFAWESREFLRRLCIGKNVSFNVVNVVSSINRTFGDIDIIYPPLKQGGIPSSISMSKAIVEAGWANVKSPSRDDKNSAIHDELVVANIEAKESKLGIYSTKKPIIRSINWAPTSADIETIFNKLKGIPTRVVIEGVKDGSSLRILLLEDGPNPFTYLPFSLAGVLCPRINTPKTDQAVDTVTHPEPYSLQSRVFSELRLLNREINVIMQGLDRMGNVLGTVLHPKGNISTEILKNGFAKISDRSLAFVAK
jgi:staphylococcal nuclease domain-containing protein 1